MSSVTAAVQIGILVCSVRMRTGLGAVQAHWCPGCHRQTGTIELGFQSWQPAGIYLPQKNHRSGHTSRISCALHLGILCHLCSVPGLLLHLVGKSHHLIVSLPSVPVRPACLVVSSLVGLDPCT